MKFEIIYFLNSFIIYLFYITDVNFVADIDFDE